MWKGGTKPYNNQGLLKKETDETENIYFIFILTSITNYIQVSYKSRLAAYPLIL